MGDADEYGTAIGLRIVNTKRNSDALRSRAEIMIAHRRGNTIPLRARVFEIADQFAFFGIDANDGETAALKSVAQIAEVEELMVAIGTVVGGELLVIDAKGIAHLMEETGDGAGANQDTEVTQRHGHLGGGSSRPLQTRNRITGGVVFEQELD